MKENENRITKIVPDGQIRMWKGTQTWKGAEIDCNLFFKLSDKITKWAMDNVIEMEWESFEFETGVSHRGVISFATQEDADAFEARFGAA